MLVSQKGRIEPTIRVPVSVFNKLYASMISLLERDRVESLTDAERHAESTLVFHFLQDLRESAQKAQREHEDRMRANSGSQSWKSKPEDYTKGMY